MLLYLVRRIAGALVVLLGVSVITFALLHAASGNIVPGLELNPTLRPEDIERIRENLGLNQPLWRQYLIWISGLVRLDFGRSILDGTPVSSQIFDRLPNTLELTVAGILMGLILSIPLGVAGALRRGSAIDNAITFLSVVGVSIPQFWLALILILLFSVGFSSWGLPWLPSGGAEAPFGGGGVVDRLAHLVMPAVVLSFSYIAVWSRFTRSSMLEALGQDYVRTARAKGLTERRVVWIHTLRNAVIPLVTLVGLELPGLLGAGAIVEIVFSWPGIGRLLLERSLQYDYTTVLGIVTFGAMLVVLGNLAADLVYAAIDPRIRLGR